MSINSDKITFSWEEYGELIDQLIQKIKANNLPKDTVLLAIGRGGYIPGVAISHALNKPLHTIGISSYKGTKLEDPHFTSYAFDTEVLDAKTILLIDDIYDTGTTLRFLENYLYSVGDEDVQIFMATVLSKDASTGKNYLDFYAAQYSKDIWIELPYEKH